MPVDFQELRYNCEGTPMHGRLYSNSDVDGPRPGVLVLPEFFGISEHTYRTASRLAELGYVALACDLHGEAFYATGVDEELKRRGELLFSNKPKAFAVGQTALDALLSTGAADNGRIGAVGYCFGGYIALELAFAGLPIAAAAAFHPSLHNVSSEQAANVKGRLLTCIGSDDPVATPEMRSKFEADLKGSGVKWQMNFYGSVKHGFTNAPSGSPDFVAYDEWADRDSWNAMTTLFAETLS